MTLGSYVDAGKISGAGSIGRRSHLENIRELKAIDHCLQLSLGGRSERDPGDGEITTILSIILSHLGSIQSSRGQISRNIGYEFEESNTLTIIGDVDSLFVGHDVSQLLGLAANGVELLHGVLVACLGGNLNRMAILVGIEHGLDLIHGGFGGNSETKIPNELFAGLETVVIQNFPTGRTASGVEQAGSGVKVASIRLIPERKSQILAKHRKYT